MKDSSGVKKRNKTQWTILRNKEYEFLSQNLPAGGRACDIGAGPQPFLDLMRRFDLTAVDIQKFDDVDVVADLEKELPFESGLFDVVIAANTFEHIYNVHNLVKECFRILKPGGVLVGVVPFFLQIHQEPHDFYRHTTYELDKMFADAGFSVRKIEPLGTARDAYYQTSYHFFSKLYHQKKYRFVVRGLWLVQRFFFLIFDWLYRTNDSIRNPLGYGFLLSK